ncbi:MAG: M48 family metallopeptidase [Bacteroidales bacterium]|nr:M48 family metallopeptidase [Bacteroidales bacterium]
MKEKVHIDPVLGEVRLRKSARTRRISIRVHPVRGILVTVPFYAPYAMGIAFLESRREWAQTALQRANARNAELPEGEDIESLRAKAKAALPPRLAELAARYGFRYHRVTIKHNTSNWGSCSSKGNINLNLNLMRVPVPLQDYILLHELTHLRHPDHGPAFHAELERLLTDHFAQNAEDEAFQSFLPAIHASRAKYPIAHVLERTIKVYRPV